MSSSFIYILNTLDEIPGDNIFKQECYIIEIYYNFSNYFGV